MNLTKLEYLRRFNQDERIAIRSAAEVSPQLQDYLAMMELAQDIDTDDADTIGAVTMLEQVGLIGAGRAAEILASPVAVESTAPQAFIATHTIQDLGAAMIDAEGTVRLADGRWTTIDALASMNKTVEVI
jgi:hypothetical protein